MKPLCQVSQGQSAHGAGTGGGEAAALNCCQKRGGTRFSLDKLFAYQLTLVKGKNIPNAICSQSGAGVGPRASCSSGSQTQFQNPRQLPPGLFWEAAQLRGTPAFEAFPVTLKPFAHPAGAASSFSGPGRLPVQPTVITLLPVSAAASAGIRFPFFILLSRMAPLPVWLLSSWLGHGEGIWAGRPSGLMG